MPRKLPPYVLAERSRHGKLVFYFRRGKGPRSRLPDLTSPDFQTAYSAALQGAVARSASKPGADSFAWLIARYRETGGYLQLSPETRRKRDGFFRAAIERAGHEPYRRITKKGIVASRDARASTPGQARGFMDAMRGLFGWAFEAGHISVNPTEGVRNPKQKTGEGFAAWSAEDVAAYEARWPRGTKERVWLDVMLYTGLRRGDASRVGWHHVRDGLITMQTEKTGMEVNIPIRSELAETLAAGPLGRHTWIAGERGLPLSKAGFGTRFSLACRAAGVKKSAHGVRKLAATIAAEAGLSVPELEALFAWTGGGMASRYTRTANRKALAMQGAGKIQRAQAPHLVVKNPAPNKSIK